MHEFYVRDACIFGRTISLFTLNIREEKNLIWGKREKGELHLLGMWYILGPVLDTRLMIDYTD